TSLVTAASVVLLSSVLGAGVTAYVYQRLSPHVEARLGPPPVLQPAVPSVDDLHPRALPLDAGATILGGSDPATSPRASEDVRGMTVWLETAGLPVYYVDVDRGPSGHWQRVLVGAYSDERAARDDLALLKSAAPTLAPRIVSARLAMSPAVPAG